ncbi:hypothetical protein [Chondromyces crocatus]|nr:hypothetical protein [Chondromyces crocatus]
MASDRFCAKCGQRLRVLSAAARSDEASDEESPSSEPSPISTDEEAPRAGPTWPYPEITQPRWASPKPTMTYVYIGSAVAFSLLFVLSPSQSGAFAPGVIALMSWAMTGYALNNAAHRKRVARELSTSGIRCWGRILQVGPAPWSTGTAIGQPVYRQTHTRVRLQVDAYAAPDPQRPRKRRKKGPRLIAELSIEEYISLAQMGMVQPGNFCALLLHPTDHSQVVLDGLATSKGDFVPLAW